MVKKLLKHELQYYFRSLLPMYLILGGVALMGRFVEFFESETTAYNILRGSSIVMMVISCAAALGLTLIFSVVRYYKNLFTGEGYLTLTLPVTTRAHLLVKLATAIVAHVASFLAVALAVCIFTVGPWLVEILKAIDYIIKFMNKELDGHFIWYMVETVPLLLTFLVAQLLLYYMCITIGQMAHKNRILAAVGVYFALYVATQIIGTICVIAVTVFGALDWFYEFLEQLTQVQMRAWTHGFIWMGVAAYGIIAGVYYLISKAVITKKLNLE